MNSFILSRCAAAGLIVCLAAAAPLHAQAPAEPGQTAAKPKPFSFGLRVRSLPFNNFGVMSNRTTMNTTPASGATPVRDWNFTTASKSGDWGVGAGLEYASRGRWTVTLEAILTPLKYSQVTTTSWGGDDPATGHDERSHSYINEDSRARVWEFPLLLHYRGLTSSGPLSKVYVAGGAALRTITNVHSTTKYTSFDATSTTDTLVVPPAKRSVVGAVAGVGLRVVDDFKINWTPEIRYTRWAGSSYEHQSTVSPKNQIELSLGFTF